jgi:hypothetical protein
MNIDPRAEQQVKETNSEQGRLVLSAEHKQQDTANKTAVVKESVAREYTNAELDEIFKNDPVWKETKRTLARMDVRKVLDKDIRGSTDPCRSIHSGDTMNAAKAKEATERIEKMNSARAVVRAILHPQ